jgi:hypothetical protein
VQRLTRCSRRPSRAGTSRSPRSTSTPTGARRRYGISGIRRSRPSATGGGRRVRGRRPRPAVDEFLDELTRPPVAETVDDEEVAAALRDGDYERALDTLLARAADPGGRDEARRTMVDLFGELGQEHPLSVAYRRKLAALLY